MPIQLGRRFAIVGPDQFEAVSPSHFGFRIAKAARSHRIRDNQIAFSVGSANKIAGIFGQVVVVVSHTAQLVSFVREECLLRERSRPTRSTQPVVLGIQEASDERQRLRVATLSRLSAKKIKLTFAFAATQIATDAR